MKNNFGGLEEGIAKMYERDNLRRLLNIQLMAGNISEVKRMISDHNGKLGIPENSTPTTGPEVFLEGAIHGRGYNILQSGNGKLELVEPADPESKK